KMRQRSGGAVAFVLDSEDWSRDPAGATAAGDAAGARLRMLRDTGWTAVRVPRGMSLDEAWRRADHERSASGPVGGS
ncbi:DUF58 domain-containing protein, partial [Streptomyces sp. SID625]|nr:DUF58 domain-containing protein [Streptomyces sp. SID625]